MTQFDPPPPGAVVIHDSRAFTFIGNPYDHVTRDGRTVTLYQWATACKVCSSTFVFGMVYPLFGIPKGCCSKSCIYDARQANMAKARAAKKAKRKARNADPAVRSAAIKAGLAKRKARLIPDEERKAAAHERRKARDRARAKARYYAKKEAAQ